MTPPEVTIITPAEGDSITGTTIISARATDNRAVARVEFLVDSTRVGVDSVPAGQVFEYTWTPAGLAPGSTHTLRCSATDRAGNRSSSAAVTVRISSTIGTHHSGTIAANETWTFAGSPHVVDSDLDIEAVLTVQPGVFVLVADGATISVGARSAAGLVARGRADSAITFTALSLSPGPGAWGGIEFRAKAAEQASVLRRCVVEHAGGEGALVRCDAGRVVIDSSELRSSSGRGVAASGNGLGSLSNSTISACAGYPVSLALGLISALGTGNTLTGNLHNGVELAGGTVAASDTWPDLGFPYCITATIAVADSSNPVLSIAPGCSLLFGESAKLSVGIGRPGGLSADGSSGRIVFGPIAAAPGTGGWQGIEFWEETDVFRTVLDYCRIEGAGAGNTPAVACYSAPVAITNTRIADNAGSGVRCQSTGFARFENDTVTGCAGFPLQIAAEHVGTIGSGNSFAGNGKPGVRVLGGAITRSVQFRRLDVPYLVTGSVEVGSQQYRPSLVIESGAELRFESGSGLSVGLAEPGKILAVGLPDSITLTGTTDTAGAWNGLALERNATSDSRLERCRLLYGGGDNRGILFIDECMPTIISNEIAFSSNCCVYLRNSPLEPDTIWAHNWIHDWAPGSDSIDYEP